MKAGKKVLTIVSLSLSLFCFFSTGNALSKKQSLTTDSRNCFFEDTNLDGLLACLNTTNADQFCMQTNSFFMTDRKSHNAPVQSVAWLCNSPFGTYAAIGGFPENNIVGNTDTRVYKFDPANGLLGNPISNLVHGSYVFGVSWVNIFDQINFYDYGAFLAVGGYPSTLDDNEVHIFQLDTTANPPVMNPVPVASYAHGGQIKSVSWLSCSNGDTAYLAIGGQAGNDGAEISILKFKASDNSLTLLANRFHGATINSVSWYYDPILYPNYPPVLAVGGDPVPGTQASGPAYITVRLFTFNCAKESLQDLIAGSQQSPVDSNIPTRVFGVRPAIISSDTINNNFLTINSKALFVGVACESTEISTYGNTFSPAFLLALFPPNTLQADASLSTVFNFSPNGISHTQVNAYTVDFSRTCTCEGTFPCCPQISFGLGCPHNYSAPLPFNIFTVGILKLGLGIAPEVTTKFDDNITSIEWCRTNNGQSNYLLVGSESNDWNLNSFCGGNEIAVYKALIVCRSPNVLGKINLIRNPPRTQPTPPETTIFGKTCLCAHKECRRFPAQSDITNVLNWGIVPDAILYNIYTFPTFTDFIVASMDKIKQAVRSLTLIASIDANAPLVFRHHCLQPCQKINYLLTATNTGGVESPVAIIRI